MSKEGFTNGPLERTFKTLVKSRRANAPDVLGFAVLNCTGAERILAIEAALSRPQRRSLEAVLRVFDQVDADLQERAVESAEAFLPVLRQNVKEKDVRVRANVCEFLVRMQDTRVAHLLAELIQDSSEQIRKSAQDGLLSLAHNYHVNMLAVEAGKADISRATLEARRFGLLDALLTALRFYSTHERPEVIAALMALDRRGDEVLMEILANPMDRRRKIILDILEAVSYPRAIRFLITMMKNSKTAAFAHEVIETRFDTAFINALLSQNSLLSSAAVRRALSGIDFVPWLRPGTQKTSELPDVLAVRAVRFLACTGTRHTEQEAIFERLSGQDRPVLASAARFVMTARAKQVSPERIDAGLVKIERSCEEIDAPVWEPDIDELVPERSPAGPDGSELLSESVLFRNFMNSFESLARSEKEAAVGQFRSRGILAREVKSALTDTDAETVLRGIRVIEYAGCQADVATELTALAKHPDSRVRSSAVRQLGKAGAYDAMKALFSILNDRDRRVLANAVEALEETGHRQILRLLDPLMKHPDNRVRANAAKASWTLGDERGRDALADMLKSPRYEMRLSGLWGLRQIGIEKEADLVRSMSRNDAHEQVRNAALMTLMTWEQSQ